MSRTAKQKKQRGDACGEYRKSVNVECELQQYLKSDPDVVKWMRGVCVGGNAVHHIFGKGNNEIYESWCNLILISTAAHLWLTDWSPVEGEILCYWAKWRKSVEQQKAMRESGMNLLIPADRQQWNPEIQGMVVRPHDGLAGRISFLMDKLETSNPYWERGLAMLRHLEGDE